MAGGIEIPLTTRNVDELARQFRQPLNAAEHNPDHQLVPQAAHNRDYIISATLADMRAVRAVFGLGNDSHDAASFAAAPMRTGAASASQPGNANVHLNIRPVPSASVRAAMRRHIDPQDAQRYLEYGAEFSIPLKQNNVGQILPTGKNEAKISLSPTIQILAHAGGAEPQAARGRTAGDTEGTSSLEERLGEAVHEMASAPSEALRLKLAPGTPPAVLASIVKTIEQGVRAFIPAKAEDHLIVNVVSSKAAEPSEDAALAHHTLYTFPHGHDIRSGRATSLSDILYSEEPPTGSEPQQSFMSPDFKRHLTIFHKFEQPALEAEQAPQNALKRLRSESPRGGESAKRSCS